MHILPTIFILSLLSGSVIRIPLFYHITVYPHDIALTIYLVLWLMWQKRYRKKIVYNPLVKPICIFIAALLISFAMNMFGHTSGEIIYGISYSLRLMLYLGIYIVITNTKNPFFWINRLYITGVLFAVIGITQYIIYPNLRNLEYLGWDPHYYRLFSTFLDPNFAGLFLILTFLLGFLFIFKRQERIEYLLFQAILLTALLLTLSRSTYIAFTTSVVLYMWWKKSWKVLVGIVLFIIAVFYVPFPQKNITPILRDDSAKARIENWTNSIGLFKERPIFGYGYNLLRTVQEPDYRTKEGFQISHAASGVDNSFLFLLVTTGIPGMAAFLYLSITVWKLGKKLAVSKKDNKLGIVYLLSLVAIGSHCLFVNSIFYPWIFIWLCILTGIVERKSIRSDEVTI